MDKSWMNAKKFSKEHVDGVNGFMRFVEERLGKECNIRCPCELCLNSYIKTQEEVKNHLLYPGIDKDYTTWIYHGERSEFQFCRSSSRDYEEDDDGANNETDLSETVGDDGIHDMLQDLGNFMQNFDRNEGTSNSSEKLLSDPPKSFTELLNEAREELYPGCLVYSKLSFIVKLLHLKVYNKWSNKSFDMLLELFRQVMPKGETIPKSYYEAKNMLRELGLGYVPIHACKYDCALFWKEHENCQTCPECGTSRWKVNDGKGKKIPHKILRYFPLLPRLQRLFLSSKIAENMRWHKDKRINDETLLSHPADSKAWKDFDQVMGEKSGYIKGLGYGPKPATKSFVAMNEKNWKLEEALQDSRTECAQLKDEVKRMETILARHEKMLERILGPEYSSSTSNQA